MIRMKIIYLTAFFFSSPLFLFISFSLSIFTQPAQADSNEKVELLTTGIFHGADVSVTQDGEWFAVISKDNKFALKRTKISIRATHDSIVDEKGQKSGKEVVADADGQIILLLKGVKGLREGPVKTFMRDQEFLYPGQSIYLNDAPGNRCFLVALGVAKDDPENPIGALGLIIENHTIRLQCGDKRQDIVNRKRVWPMPEHMAYPLWVGDIDRDGKPDLLMELTDHYNVSEKALFLSSAAAKGKLVGQVALFRTTGC